MGLLDLFIIITIAAAFFTPIDTGIGYVEIPTDLNLFSVESVVFC